MCGRYTLKRAEIIARYGHELFKSLGVYSLSALYNAAPSQSLPVLARNSSGVVENHLMRWGIIPFWDKSDKPKLAPFNARSEEVMGKRIFSQSLQKRRCLVPADGFYEWKKLSETLREPHHIQLKDGAPFFFAGIYDQANSSEDGMFAILTTRANALMEKLHQRMPIILRGEAAVEWMRDQALSEAELSTFRQPYPESEMEEWIVSRAVGNVRNSGPDLVLPAPVGEMRVERADGEQLNLL